ncbi:MAG: pantoate--beta-alanine ligase [Spirochaetaceae bacterium]|jgi:pantoate--beta-alanine ligase|nr:pantoate--beta-alanine ligase [Spirochaetaceae bacterium]
MIICNNLQDLREQQEKLQGTIGFVPTMGALHQGHLSLIESSQQQNTFSVVSIYLNPTQFDNPQDLSSYPNSLEQDKELLEQRGVDILFLPRYKDLYPLNYRYKITENELSNKFCGASRPGHFDGVLTVVMKLLQMVRPQRAYFGEKDYQQYLLIRDMAQAFFLDTEIIPCPLIRQENGLAMSSRNRRLTAEQQKIAPLFYKELSSGKSLEEIHTALEAHGFVVDYLEEYQGRRLAAVFSGKVRLIDNV